MKTTITLRDDLARRLKSHAALQGQSFSKYLEECLEEQLNAKESQASTVGEWIAKLPRVPPEEIESLNAVLHDADFNRIDGDMWQ